MTDFFKKHFNESEYKSRNIMLNGIEKMDYQEGEQL
jgi:hypothetical protein